MADCLNHSGILDVIGAKSSSVSTPKKFIITWYLVAFILSGFFNDMTIAALIIPIAVEYARKVNFDKISILLTTIVFGISSGGDLTVFGGNDNLSALGMLKGTQYEFTKAQWTPIFIIPTILIGVVALIACIRMCKDMEWERTEFIAEDIKVNYLELFITIALIILAFHIHANILVILAFLACLGFKHFDYKRIPYRALCIWIIAFLIGKLIGAYVPALQFNHPWALFGALIICTNIFTNTALMSGFLPVLIAANVPTFMMYGAIKSINIAYMSIYGNSCFAVASGYGIEQKDLFKRGLPVAIASYIIILVYFLVIAKVM